MKDVCRLRANQACVRHDCTKMNVEMLSSQILGKRFSQFPNGSRTHDHPEYRLERSNH